ncbi:hypothetical protein J18TS1_12250 [Oceanobacillus oncorhynchi subsp. incaldanensis]|uniref:hypothetical protein n=1 Tax=Oceanobacillus oncorhynchi TaxID=545501 RepID=UPI001AFFCA3A|nr:hypothetical protein [Oceanobacillus oncorhynchi]GIO18125.1 hypothetical protein J18TS1_12250 [Oceanobacillus oncorhynchi subsp. incaldanensis]
MGVVKFKTNGKHIPLIPLNGQNDFIFEDDELAFFPGQLSRIADLYNGGMDVPEIADAEDRTIKEILLALIDLAYKEQITRPLAYIY